MQKNNHHSRQDDERAEKRQSGSTVLFIRHGESEAHIGKAAKHTEEIRLTKSGLQQAAEIAYMFPREPDLIISSPYLRAWETAAPTLQRYAHVSREIWPVHEFTYLGSLAGVCSTKQERRVLVDAYWERCDPHYKDSDGESFAQFISRVRTILDRLRRLEGFTAVFTHEQFMRAAQGLLHGWMEDTQVHMKRFRERLLESPLPYGCMLEMPLGPPDGGGWERFRQREYIPRSLLVAPAPSHPH